MDEHTAVHVEEKTMKMSSFFGEVIKFVLIAVFVVLPIRLYIAQPFIVSGSSMDPTFLNGEYLIVDELSYRFEDPHRGDVIVFRFPQDTSKFFIKRIIGLPGETVHLEGTAVRIENKEHPEGFFLDEPFLALNTRNFLRIQLDDNEYFVMGDNRPASSDSRIWGPLQKEYIIGRAFVRLLPVNKFNLFPGEYDYQEAVTNEN